MIDIPLSRLRSELDTQCMDGMRLFGELVRRARERQGLRGEDLAAKIGRAPSWVSRLELGGSANPPDPHMFGVLSDVLGLQRAEMLEALGYLVRSNEAEAPEILEEPAIPREVKVVLAELDWSDPETAKDAASMLRIIAKRNSPFRSTLLDDVKDGRYDNLKDGTIIRSGIPRDRPPR